MYILYLISVILIHKSHVDMLVISVSPNIKIKYLNFSPNLFIPKIAGTKHNVSMFFVLYLSVNKNLSVFLSLLFDVWNIRNFFLMGSFITVLTKLYGKVHKHHTWISKSIKLLLNFTFNKTQWIENNEFKNVSSFKGHMWHFILSDDVK